MTHGAALVTLASEYVENLTPANNIFGGKTGSSGEEPMLTRRPYFTRSMCSSFLTLLINQRFDVAPVLFVGLFLSKSPTASRYFEAAARGMIGATKRVNEVEVGDMLFIKYSELRNGFTGHSALVAAKPVKTDEPFGSFEVYTVEIIDSCRSSHGPGDTRFSVTGEERGGVGRGTMRLLTSKGFVVGYLWRSKGASEVNLDGHGLELLFGKIPESWPLRAAT